MYQSGRGVKKDHAAAIAWLRKAAENGSAEAQYELGYAYSEGNGVPEDPQEAVRWYRLAAAGGSPLAQNNLAVSYLLGAGVGHDTALAYQFSLLAQDRAALVRPAYQRSIRATLERTEAMLSDSQKRTAMFQLGEKCRDGDGVPQNDVRAYRWMDASARDEPDEQLRATRRAARDTLAERMRPDQVARAQMMSRSGNQP
jgi:hypothetical protein